MNEWRQIRIIVGKLQLDSITQLFATILPQSKAPLWSFDSNVLCGEICFIMNIYALFTLKYEVNYGMKYMNVNEA